MRDETAAPTVAVAVAVNDHVNVNVNVNVNVRRTAPGRSWPAIATGSALPAFLDSS